MNKVAVKQINLETTIDQIVLTEFEITTNEIPRNDLYEIKLKDVVYGPIYKDDLKKFLFFHKELVSDARIKKVNVKSNWTPPHEHPLFQRKKAHVVSRTDINIEKDTFYTLVNGQKSGPYTFDQIIEQFKSKKFFATDVVSIDEGQTWKKIHQFDEFERIFGKSNLPESIRLEVLENKNYSYDQDESFEKDETLIELAHMGHLNNNIEKKTSTIVDKEEEQIQQDIEELHEKIASPRKYSFILILLGMIALSAVIFKTNFPFDSKRTATTNQKVKPENTKKPKIYRPTAKKIKKRRPIKRRTITRTRSTRVRPKKKKRTVYYKRGSDEERENKQKTGDSRDDDYDERRDNYDADIDPIDAEPIAEVKPRNNRKNVKSRLLKMADEEGDYFEAPDEDLTIRSREDFEDDGPDSEEDLFDEELAY